MLFSTVLTFVLLETALIRLIVALYQVLPHTYVKIKKKINKVLYSYVVHGEGMGMRL